MKVVEIAKNRIHPKRFVGTTLDESLNEVQPDAVPDLKTILERVKSGLSTGLGAPLNEQYDDEDYDVSLMDPLDLEARKQELADRLEQLKSTPPTEKKEVKAESDETERSDVEEEKA